ncbi:mRNA-capping enzyme-like [Salvelinus alpinus]
MKTGQIDKTKEPFSVRNKPFFDIHAARKLCVTASSILSQKKTSEFLDRCALGAHRQNRKHPHDPDTELMPRTAPKRPNRAAPHSGGSYGSY